MCFFVPFHFISIRFPFHFHLISSSIPFPFHFRFILFPFDFRFISNSFRVPFDFHSISVSFRFHSISVSFPVHFEFHTISIPLSFHFRFIPFPFDFHFISMPFPFQNEKCGSTLPSSFPFCARNNLTVDRTWHVVRRRVIDVPIKAWTAGWESLFVRLEH